MRRPTLPFTLLLAGGLLLTGCGGGDDGAARESDGGSASTAQDTSGSTGPDQPTSDQSADNGGDTDVELGSLPDDFPEDDVPLVDGKIVTAVSTPGVNGGFAATLTVDGSFEEAFDEALAMLEDAGFTVESRDTIGGYQASRLTSDDYLVVVTGGEADGEAALIYTIQPAQ